jgi:hypothetical protein
MCGYTVYGGGMVVVAGGGRDTGTYHRSECYGRHDVTIEF